jgi:hypothetical protein
VILNMIDALIPSVCLPCCNQAGIATGLIGKAATCHNAGTRSV